MSSKISLRISDELQAAIDAEAVLTGKQTGPLLRAKLCQAFGVEDEPLPQGFAAAGQPRKAKKRVAKRSKKIS